MNPLKVLMPAHGRLPEIIEGVLEERQIASDLQRLQDRIEEFQRTRFPDQTLDSKLAHCGREIKELRANPTDPHEWADVFILILGAAAKDHRLAADLINAAHAKMDINERRSWGAPDHEGVYHHTEEPQ